MKIILTLWFLALAFVAVGAPTKQEIERMTDLELIDLLTNDDSSARCASLLILGLRFNNPESPVTMSPFLYQPCYPKGVTLPKGLLEKTVSLAKTDDDVHVRLVAVMALGMFKFRTNTTPILTALLDDPTCIIRIRAAQGLIDFSDDYHEPISDTVISTLISCLDSTNPPDDVWQAEESLGDLGARAKQSLPFLVKLKHSKSPEVREYASEAIRKIKKELKRQKN
ncbi:MAG TPA: HEAT repeat domain-containing protein [Candidatus Sulfotelmatobacter sp.]|nr:HEAT repeat domain-containing protein [Candidatus Sulfotelmatobacter sp.]